MAEKRARNDEGSGRKEEGEKQGAWESERSPSLMLSPFSTPFTLMRRFFEDLDLLFEGGGRTSQPRAGNGESGFFPPIEMSEQDSQLVIRADIPGLTKDEIRIDVEDRALVLCGERTHAHEEKRSGFFRSERRYGRFARTIPLPDGVNAEQAKAKFANGVLEITMPIARPTAQRIEIEDASSKGTAQRPEAQR
jgi:HSP20 family protein